MSQSLIMKLLRVNKCLNETTEIVGDSKRPNSEHRDSSAH